MTTAGHGRTGGIIRRAEFRPNSTALMVFLSVAAIYLINPDPFWSGDMNSNTILAFNVLEFRTIHLDAFAESHIYKSFGGYSFSQPSPTAPAGPHYTLSYPVGTAVVTFPLYVLFYAYLKFFAPGISPLAAEFEPYRLAFSHIAAAILSAGSVTFFFLIARTRFSTRAALITTGCLAFATMQWGLLSQSLLQQGSSSVVIMAAAYLLLRAEKANGAGWTVLAAGILTGLLFLIRPTNLVFMAALLAFATLRFRRWSWPFHVGVVASTFLSVGWNWFYFSSWIGAASVFQAHSYLFTFGTFASGLLGLTISPNHGVLANSPVLIFALVGVATLLRRTARERMRNMPAIDLLFVLLLGACAVLLVSYAFTPFWDGGGSYGSRYLSETMPVLAYFLNFLPALRSSRTVAAIFATCIALGVFNQVSAIVGGHEAYAAWASIPYGTNDVPEDRRWAYMREAPLKAFQSRRWSLRDSLNERIWRGVYANRFLMPPINPTFVRHAGCNASIISIEDSSGLGVDQFKLKSVEGLRPFAERLWEATSEGRKFVHVRVRNDGTIPLYGYQSGLTWGYATMVHKVSKESGDVVIEAGTVYVSDTIHPGETGDAFGSMYISTKPGRYRIEARTAVSGIGYCGPAREFGTVTVE
jgi:Dolichyl-phosphate-mannose-protein mannosyltransferase